MTEEQASKKAPASAPPPQAGAESRARGPLARWGAPAFWMSCGALLAGLVAGAVILVQRVGVERDMMAVAATMPMSPPPVAPIPAVAAAVPVPQVQPVPRAPAAQAVKALAQQSAARKHKAKPRPRVYRVRMAIEKKYPEVFRRCRPLGESGAVECRHHICNGAERDGPACKPYRSKPR
ncbi:hypothetical protein [Pseudoduganella violaceinigra]|uniref:hypothetical protein n=1 Tax=Pseudoduganella violaceinigra TaxID=246602 RepID=UPI0004851874|nr:hypothetical protein [Pseudoduganella violaceinigra]